MAKNKTSAQYLIPNPLVSVIMPVYNGERYLRESIDSILSQTYRNFELIIINDGSTDKTDDIVRSYNDSRIRFVRQLNHGLVYTLNKGIGLARGSFIARQDADDISLPTRFEKELILFASRPALGLVGTFFTYVEETTLTPSITITSPTLDIDIKRNMYFTNPIGHGTVMIRKSVFEETEWYTNDYGPTEDFELWRRIADNWELGIVPESLYWYRLNSGSISHKSAAVQHEFTAKIIAEQWEKPFRYKSRKHIWRDAKFYRSMHSLQAQHVYAQYVAQQVDIARALLTKGWFRFGIEGAYAAYRMEPRTAKRFIKPFLRGVKHRVLRLV